jgi:hypothetical protein
MDNIEMVFEKYIKMNGIMTVFPDDVSPVVKDQLVDKAEKDGYKVTSKVKINGHDSWLISKKELSEFQKRRMVEIMYEMVQSMSDDCDGME